MKKNIIVKSNKEFTNIIETGHQYKNRFLVIYTKQNKLKKNRFGITVGTKVGNAVIRNKFKRQIRNIVDNCKIFYSKDLDYIIIVRKSCLNASYDELNSSFNKIINNINKDIKGETNEK